MSTSIRSLVGGEVAIREDVTEPTSGKAWPVCLKSGVLGSCGDDKDSFPEGLSEFLDFSCFCFRST